MSIDIFQKLITTMADHKLDYIPSSEVIEVLCADQLGVDKVKSDLLNIDIDSEELFGNKLRFNINSFPFKLFWNLLDFRSKMLFEDENGFEIGFKNDFAVIRCETDPYIEKSIYFNHQSQQTFIDFSLVEDYFFFTNAKIYVWFLHFLKKSEYTEDSSFHFVDYFSWDSRVFVFVSLTKKGKLNIPFPNGIPDFPSYIDLSKRFQRFNEAFINNDKKQMLPKFIKAELFNFLGEEIKENRLLAFIEKLNQILIVAEQNFDIYLYDLSLENLKKDYLESKDKYFGQLREILGKITAQIIALPISISVVALATYDIPATQDKTLIIPILILAFVVYSLFAVFLLKLYKEDISDIEHQYNRDFLNLENSDFFINNKEEKTYFDDVKARVIRKIVTMKWTVNFYLFLLTVTNSILLWKLLSDINFYPLLSVIFGIIQIILFCIFYSQPPETKNSESN